MVDALYLLLCAGASLARMVAAYIVSVATALVVGTAMARNRAVERALLPVLDVLQSIPILGFFPAALALFVRALPPGLGAEAAAVFLIFTSQVWNLIFGVYASIKSLERQLFEMTKVYGLGRAATFFYVCAPAAKSSLVANTLISWAGGWFFLTSSEIIALGAAEYRLTGIGTFIMEAFERGDASSFYAGVATLLAVILATYVLFLNPAGEEVLERKLLSVSATYAVMRGFIGEAWSALANALVSLERKLRLPSFAAKLAAFTVAALLVLAALREAPRARAFDASRLLTLLVGVAEQLPVSVARVAFIVALSAAISLAAAYVSYARAGGAALMTLAGEALASIPAVIWWPLLSSVALGSPYGPHVVAAIVMLQGALWYLYFNLLVYGLASLRRELDEMAKVYGIRGRWYLRAVFAPSLLPSLAAGALSAWGGAWNATIAAEYATFGDRVIDLGGVGALIAKEAEAGDTAGVTFTALLLSLIIVAVNKTLWRKVFQFVESRYGGVE